MATPSEMGIDPNELMQQATDEGQAVSPKDEITTAIEGHALETLSIADLAMSIRLSQEMSRGAIEPGQALCIGRGGFTTQAGYETKMALDIAESPENEDHYLEMSGAHLLLANENDEKYVLIVTGKNGAKLNGQEHGQGDVMELPEGIQEVTLAGDFGLVLNVPQRGITTAERRQAWETSPTAETA